jgi:outer membrane protein assembly factor BamB
MNAATPRALAGLAAGLVFVSTLAAETIGWRTDGTGTYPGAVPPTDWGEKNVVWKTKLPGQSYGSPILVGDRIFVVSDPAELLCLSAADGKVLWQRSQSLEDVLGADTGKKVVAEFARLKAEQDRLRRERDKTKDDAARKAELDKQVKATEAEQNAFAARYPAPPAIANRGSTNSAATPTSDGKHVYAVFGNGIACAYTTEGEKLWVRFVESSVIGFGHSSSPVLVDGKLLIHLKELVALDAGTGKEVWRTPLDARYATPVPARVGTTAVVVSPAGAVVRLADGRVMLRSGNLSSSEGTPVVHDDIVYTFDGRARASRLVPAGDGAVKLERLWEKPISGGRRTPSSLLLDGLLYAVNTDGTLDVLDAATGELQYQQRLKIGEVYASATAAGGYLFFGGTKGETVVIKPGKEYQEVARSKVEGFGSSPVFSGRRLYLRTRQNLYCIGE